MKTTEGMLVPLLYMTVHGHVRHMAIFSPSLTACSYPCRNSGYNEENGSLATEILRLFAIRLKIGEVSRVEELKPKRYTYC